MARRPKRRYKRRKITQRSMANYLKGNIDIDIAMGTLASDTALLAATNTVIEKTRCTSINNRYVYSGYTVAVDQGPVMVGVAHSDYSLAEIEAWIEQTSSWDAGNLVAKEISQRRIRRIGIFPIAGSTGGVGNATVLNEGRPIRTRLNWMLMTGQGLVFFVYNLGTVALASTDPNVNIQGDAHLFTQ